MTLDALDSFSKHVPSCDGSPHPPSVLEMMAFVLSCSSLKKQVLRTSQARSLPQSHDS